MGVEMTASQRNPQRTVTINEDITLLNSIASGLSLQFGLDDANVAAVPRHMEEIEDLATRMEDVACMLRVQTRRARDASTIESRSFKKGKKLPFFVRFQVVMVLALQAANVAAISNLDINGPNAGNTYTTLTDSLMSLLQIASMLLVGICTAILSKKLFQKSVEPLFMAQTYFSTVLVFAGLYFVIYRFSPTSWDIQMDKSPAVIQYIRLLYLSTSAATLCGAANIQPAAWYTILLVCIQSLINFVYFASILAQTIGNYNTYTVEVKKRPHFRFRTYSSITTDDCDLGTEPIFVRSDDP